MTFIIPQNYNFKSKLFGIIDYPTAIFNIAFIVILYFILKLLPFGLLAKSIILVVCYLPLSLISIFGFYSESFLFVFIYFFKFLITPKVYIYK